MRRGGVTLGFPGGTVIKTLPAMQESQVQSLGGDDPLEKETAICSSILPGESHGQRSLAGYSPWGHKELDMTEQLNNKDDIPLSSIGWKEGQRNIPKRGMKFKGCSFYLSSEYSGYRYVLRPDLSPRATTQWPWVGCFISLPVTFPQRLCVSHSVVSDPL